MNHDDLTAYGIDCQQTAACKTYNEKGVNEFVGVLTVFRPATSQTISCLHMRQNTQAQNPKLIFYANL
jgi:hypothetical protein